MPCYHPLTGYQRNAGSPLFFQPVRLARRVVVPCGQCRGCRLDRSAQWAVRCIHEASLHEHNQFVTLTYAENPQTLVPRDLQLFLKRLRRVQPFRFLGCGEYGETYSRPHYHLLLFGFPCMDRYPWRKSAAGFQLYRSPGLEQVWSLGSVEVGEVSLESAAYCARYAMKKQTGKDAGRVREIVDVTTGEIITRAHEFLRMSLKPGIAAKWYERYWCDVYPEGQVVLRGGVKRKAPRYYDKLFKAQDPEAFEELVRQRVRLADEHFDDNSPARLRVKEIVEAAKLSLKKRSL